MNHHMNHMITSGTAYSLAHRSGDGQCTAGRLPQRPCPAFEGRMPVTTHSEPWPRSCQSSTPLLKLSLTLRGTFSPSLAVTPSSNNFKLAVWISFPLAWQLSRIGKKTSVIPTFQICEDPVRTNYGLNACKQGSGTQMILPECIDATGSCQAFVCWMETTCDDGHGSWPWSQNTALKCKMPHCPIWWPRSPHRIQEQPGRWSSKPFSGSSFPTIRSSWFPQCRSCQLWPLLYWILSGRRLTKRAPGNN